MRICVIVPTTEGPATILRLSRLLQAPRSVMRTQDDYRPLPPSARYHAFVQPGGPLANRIGFQPGPAMVRDRPLPVACAPVLGCVQRRSRPGEGVPDRSQGQIVRWLRKERKPILQIVLKLAQRPADLRRRLCFPRRRSCRG